MSKTVVIYRDMNKAIHSPHHLSDSDLIAEVNRLAQSAREAIATLVSALGELDARRLYLGQGCSSSHKSKRDRVGSNFTASFHLHWAVRRRPTTWNCVAPHITATRPSSVLACSFARFQPRTAVRLSQLLENADDLSARRGRLGAWSGRARKAPPSRRH
jgi:hypothetical protein